MTQSEDQDKQYLQFQYERLGYFLIASAFLVAAFLQLITMDKGSNTLITEDKVYILVHAVAALGSLIAALYFFMSSWLVITKWLEEKAGVKKSTGAQVHHTWFIPLCFLAFWLVVWIYVIGNWWVCAILLVIPVFYLFQRFRDKLSSFSYKRLRRLLQILVGKE